MCWVLLAVLLGRAMAVTRLSPGRAVGTSLKQEKMNGVSLDLLLLKREETDTYTQESGDSNVCFLCHRCFEMLFQGCCGELVLEKFTGSVL